MEPPYAVGSAPSLSCHAITYRWRSLPRVLRRRASRPRGSSERVLPGQVTMDQLIFASISHTHYWYEVGMLKIPVYAPDKEMIHSGLWCIYAVYCIAITYIRLVSSPSETWFRDMSVEGSFRRV